MAENLFKKYTESKTEEWEVPASTQAGVLVIDPQDTTRPGVTITARGDSTRTITVGKRTITEPNGGVGNKPTAATVAVDGAWLFPVAGVTNGETVAGTGTKRGTGVYRTAAGALNLTAASNTKIGVIADGAIVDGIAPIWIGI